MFKKLIKLSSTIILLLLFSLWLDKQIIFAQSTASNNPDSPHKLSLEVDKTQAVANGVDAIAITATLKDRTTFEPLENPTQGTPIANVRLIFEVSGGGVNLSQQSQLTDANGQIKAFLTTTTAGTKTITVTDPSLNLAVRATDYYKVSLSVTFTLVGTSTPLPSPTSTFTPTPAETIPTPTPTPWQPSGPIKTDPQSSYFTINPWQIGTHQSAIIKITLLDKEGNLITDEVPYITATGEGNHIVQPTAKANSLAYFSASVKGRRTISVRIADVKIGEKMGDVLTGEDASYEVVFQPTATTMSRLDIPLTNSPPKENLVINAHRETPIYFYVPAGRHVDRVTAVIVCSEGQQEIPLSLYEQNGRQVFRGYTPVSWPWGSQSQCKFRVTMEPLEEPGEPPPEIPVEPIDPFGVVYDAKTGEKISDATVTLYELQDSKWIVWNGLALQQVNPQTTDESGLYSFFVYPGKYYLTVEKEGYDSFQSETIEVVKEAVKLDVYLNPKPEVKLWLWTIALLIPVGFVVTALFIWQRKGKGIKPSETQPVELQPNAH